jgi:aspartate/methionine/tyrosine aminotransferase
MRQFPASPITALMDEKPRFNFGESLGADLTFADLLGPADVTAAGLVGAAVGYGTSVGDPALRALVASRLGIPDDQVLITTGAAAALFLVAWLCGDGEVLIGQPCFPPALDMLRGLGARVATVRSRFEYGYRIDLDALAARLTPGTRLVAFASPQNPAAVSITGDEVDQMLAAMSSTCPEALLLIDETYREATYTGAPPAATFAGRSPRLLTCASLSKAYGAPGLRIGWLTVPQPELYEQLRLAKFNSSVCCGVLDELLATSLLSRADQVLGSRGALMTETRDIVERWIGANAGRLRWLRPEAGAFCSVQLDPAVFGPGEIGRFHAYLTQERILVAPGTWFQDSPNVFRLGHAYEPASQLEKGLNVITAALEASVSR